MANAKMKLGMRTWRTRLNRSGSTNGVRSGLLGEQGDQQGRRAREQDQSAYVKREVAGLRPTGRPAGTQLDSCRPSPGRRPPSGWRRRPRPWSNSSRGRGFRSARPYPAFSRPRITSAAAGARPRMPAAPARCGSGTGRGPIPEPAAHSVARKPASAISSWWRSAASATHASYSSPVMKVVLKAPLLMKSCHSGVSRTFVNRST